MQCKNVEKLLLDYIADRLDDDQRVLIEKHLESCPSCREKLREETRISTFLGTAKKSDEDEDFHRMFMAKLEEEMKRDKKKTPVSFSNLPLLSRGLIVLGFLGFFAVIGIVVFKLQTPTEQYFTSYGEAGYTWVSKKGFEIHDDQNDQMSGSDHIDGTGWGGAYAALAGIDLDDDDEDKVVHQFDLNLNGHLEENGEEKKSGDGEVQ